MSLAAMWKSGHPRGSVHGHATPHVCWALAFPAMARAARPITSALGTNALGKRGDTGTCRAFMEPSSPESLRYGVIHHVRRTERTVNRILPMASGWVVIHGEGVQAPRLEVGVPNGI